MKKNCYSQYKENLISDCGVTTDDENVPNWGRLIGYTNLQQHHNQQPVLMLWHVRFICCEDWSTESIQSRLHKDLLNLLEFVMWLSFRPQESKKPVVN